MCHRCEARVHRGNKRVLNGFRMETLLQMIRDCYDYAGMTTSESQNMMDNVVAMTDLSEDEYSPRHGLSMDIKQNEIQQAYHAFQVGLDLMRCMREAERRQDENPDGETNNEETSNEQMDQNSSSGSEGVPERLGDIYISHWRRHLIQICGWKFTMEVMTRWKMEHERSETRCELTWSHRGVWIFFCRW